MKNILYTLILSLLGNIAIAQTPLWKQVSAGGEFSVAIKSDSSMYSWGLNTFGQLGNDDISNNPVLEPTIISEYTDWVEVATGAYHSVAIKDSGSIYGWGYNGYGAVNELFTNIVDKPVLLSSKTNWVKVYAGLHTSFAINDKGHLYAWGKNTFGQLGINTNGESVGTPTVIDSTKNWEKVACGHDFTLFLDDSGNIYGSGRNNTYQLTNQFSDEVHEIVLLDSANLYLDIGANYSTGHAITFFKEIVSWGSNRFAESGNATNQEVLEEISPTDFRSGYSNLYCGSVYCLVENDDDFIYGFGTNVLGAIGIGDEMVIRNPILISEDRYDNISASIGLSDGLEIYGGHTLWLKKFEKNYFCGSGANYVGQLGNGEKHQNVNSLTCDLNVIVSTDQNPVFKQVKVYPNPTKDIVNVTNNDGNIQTYALYDLSGRLISKKSVDLQNIISVDLSNLNIGIYILYLQDKDGNKLTAKVVKN